MLYRNRYREYRTLKNGTETGSTAHAWYEVFTGTIRAFGFKPSKVMPCFWYKLAKDGESYDYLTHHVDDFLLTSDEFTEFMEYLRQDYVVTGGEFPSIHLGMNIQQDKDGNIILSCHDYICEPGCQHNFTCSELNFKCPATPVYSSGPN